MTLTFKKPAILFQGGPWDGWARFEDEMDQAVRSYEYLGATYPYEPTEEFVVHPRTAKKIHSRVWRYRGPGPESRERPNDSMRPESDPVVPDQAVMQVLAVLQVNSPFGSTVSDLMRATRLGSVRVSLAVNELLRARSIVETADGYVLP